MMIIGIHPDHSGMESYSEKWVESLNNRGVEVRILNLLAPDALEQVKNCDGIMWRIIHRPQDKQSARRILYIIEHYLNIPVFPDYNTAWHYDEKIAQYYLFQVLGVPTPQTWLFWNEQEALDWAQTAPYPVVFKLSSGASSTNVHLVSSKEHAIQLINRMFNRGVFPNSMQETIARIPYHNRKEDWRKLGLRLRFAWEYFIKHEYPSLPEGWWWRPEFGYAYFQEFVPGNSFDTRIFIIGDRAFGYRRLNFPDDFRASGSMLNEYEPEKVDLECIRIAYQISREGRFQTMGYDFLYKDGKPLITEISYISPDKSLHECRCHWLPNMERIDGQIWPEEAQLDQLLKQIKSNIDFRERNVTVNIPMSKKPRILLIADVPNWIFARHCEKLRNFLSNDFDFEVAFRFQEFEEDTYDLIYPLEFDMVKPEQIHNPQKYITGIRSHVSWSSIPFLDFTRFLNTHYQIIHVVSKRLFNIFKPYIQNLKYVTHGVDTLFFTPCTSASLSNKNLRLGWAGNREYPLKGFEAFIKPLGNLQGVEIVHCGFLDNLLSISDMKKFYDSIDAYICASANIEGNNNSLLEAACMERAIITTDNGTVREYLIDGVNSLIVERDIDSFISAVERLRDNPESRVEIGRRARKAIIEGGWDWKNKAEDYRELFWMGINGQQTKEEAANRSNTSTNDNPAHLLSIVESQWELECELRHGLEYRIYQQTDSKGLISILEEKNALIPEIEQNRDQRITELQAELYGIYRSRFYRFFLWLQFSRFTRWLLPIWQIIIKVWERFTTSKATTKKSEIQPPSKFDETGPPAEESKPVFEEPRPAVEVTRQGVEVTRSAIEETRSEIKETEPSIEESKPLIEETEPTLHVTIPIITPEETEFNEQEIKWIEDFDHSPLPLSVIHPDWVGVRSATYELFEKVFELEDDLDEKKGKQIARMFKEAGVTAVVSQGLPLTHKYLVIALHEIAPEIPIFVVWHGGFIQKFEDSTWEGFKLIDQLCREGTIRKWGFVKKGMAEVMAQTGLETGFVMNMVRAIPVGPSIPLPNGPHLGIWASSRKLPYVMIAAAKMVNHATLNMWGSDARGVDFFRFMQLKGNVSTKMLLQREVKEVLPTMHVNLYISLYDCAPMLPLESLSVGVPCLFGPHSHYFEDHEYLHSRLVVPSPDRADIIAHRIEQALEEREQIILAYSEYAPEYNRRAAEVLRNFLEV